MFNEKNKQVVEQLRQELRNTPSVELFFVDAAIRSDEVQAEEVIKRVSELRPDNPVYARVKELLNGKGV